ncbi:MAG: hypothetical protein QM780_13150 [Hyphomicrobium sp.]|uniref:hypothetical protein n=1 Tax=Hyphomicrobium sp. TaxID=82 RepID=UPI0039E549F1
MPPDLDPFQDREFKDWEVRPTANSAWVGVVVLLIGVSLAGWYVLGRVGTSRILAFASGSPSDTHEALPPKPTP